MATAGGGPPMYSGYGQPPKIRFEVISEAWQLFTQQMKTWVLAVLVMIVIMMIPGFIMGFGMVAAMGLGAAAGERGGAAIFGLGTMAVMFVGMLVMIVLAFIMMGGLYRMAIKQVRGEPIQLSDLWSVTDVLPQLALGGLLMGLSMGIASLACYLPMFIVGGLLMLTIPLIVDQKMPAIEAMTRSWNTLKQEWLMAAVLYFVLNFVAGIGAIALYVGMLFTYPLLFLGTALVYRDFILGGSGGGPQLGYPTPYPTNVTPGANPPDLYAPQPQPQPQPLPQPPPDEQR
jgi:hypothetical protein